MDVDPTLTTDRVAAAIVSRVVMSDFVVDQGVGVQVLIGDVLPARLLGRQPIVGIGTGEGVKPLVGSAAGGGIGLVSHASGRFEVEYEVADGDRSARFSSALRQLFLDTEPGEPGGPEANGPVV